ncbi:MAG: nitrite reductase small subunit NirD [Pseudomonadota bacterium]
MNAEAADSNPEVTATAEGTAGVTPWRDLCSVADLTPGAGVAALVDGEQIALFFLPEEQPPVYAIGNYDPIGDAHVLSRGVVGDIKAQLVVASPLYKQHFRLSDGQCLEQDDVRVPSYPVRIQGDRVEIQMPTAP